MRSSGSTQEFDTGSHRDSGEGKPPMSLLPVVAVRRWASWTGQGAAKYGKRNWEKGQPFDRTLDSLLRHAFAYLDGDREEDHLAAIMWNAAAVMFFEEKISRGELPAELDNLPRNTKEVQRGVQRNQRARRARRSA